MDFCILSPIAGLERYSRLSKTHLLLPQLQNLPGYAGFYRARREEDDLVILDNGAYEGVEPTSNSILEGIGRFDPQVTVLPDYLLQDWHKTWYAANNFLDRYFYVVTHTKWMFVPQSEPGDIVGFIEGLFRALDDERITWIGLPRALTYSITNDLFMRVRVAEQIRKRSSVKIHALGMAKGSLEELNQLNKIACVSSIDSNAPVWRGWKGYFLEGVKNEWNVEEVNTDWPEIPCNYSEEFAQSPVGHGNERHNRILRNLEACGVNVDNSRK